MSRIPFSMQPNEEDDGASVHSVGRVLEEGQVYNLSHPAYKVFSQQLAQEIEEIAKREQARRSAAEAVLLPFSTTPDENSALAVMYPEFNIVTVPLNYPVHRFWTASQSLGNELLLSMASQYAESIVHVGGSRLSAMMKGNRGVHVEYSPHLPVAVHKHHSTMVDLHRVFRDYTFMQTEYGAHVPRGEFDAYLRGDAYDACDSGSCVHQGDALCMDLSMYAISPDQFASAMVQHGAQVGFGFFVYHPVMLVNREGEIPHTGVRFRRNGQKMLLEYPEGKAGASGYGIAQWCSWLSSHCFCLPGGKAWFQLELMKNRGPFMFFRMVRVPAVADKGVFRHALELPDATDSMLVKSWRLKNGLKSDPNSRSSWEPHHFLVAARTERRVREFAMQLDSKSFTRFAVKKQVRVVNNRWVLTGTTVTVMPPLAPQEVEDLTTAIYASCFVSRYESGRLSSEMMSALSKLKGFNDLAWHQRVAAVSLASMSWLYNHSVAPFLDHLRTGLDKAVGFLTGRLPAMDTGVVAAPQYIPMKSVVGTFGARLRERGEYCASVDKCMRSVHPDGNLPGGLLLAGARSMVRVREPTDGLANVTTEVTDMLDITLGAFGEQADAFVEAVARNNAVDPDTERRAQAEFSLAARVEGEIEDAFKFTDDPDPAATLNQAYAEAFGTVASQRFEADTFSLSLDPQDRTMSALHLRMPTYFGAEPAARDYYESNLVALNVPKRQNTGQELLSAIGARNLSAPTLAQPQDEPELVKSLWDNFLDNWCVPDARQKLAEYQQDVVSLGEQALRDWSSKAKEGILERVIQELGEQAMAMGDKPVGEYLAMLKADVKPTLSVKPVDKVVAPQVIVYHEKALSALYSSVFRVLVRRFLSLVKPNVHINLLKDTKDMAGFLTGVHPFGTPCKYLENDFSQFDKSQAGFVFALEEHVFRQLGMNEEFLQQWEIGHHYSNIRCVSTGLSLHTMYQRKSGDATTAFGNVIVNILTVSWAYRGTDFVWALFMGDDSLVCTAGAVVGADEAVRVLAEQFNLIAKYYITEAPYFASNFVCIDENALTVGMVPDPIKRIEKLSMSVTADDPQWRERWTSLNDTLAPFRNVATAGQLAVLVPQRYSVPEGFVRGVASALDTLSRDFPKFRGLWGDDPVRLQG